MYNMDDGNYRRKGLNEFTVLDKLNCIQRNKYRLADSLPYRLFNLSCANLLSTSVKITLTLLLTKKLTAPSDFISQ